MSAGAGVLRSAESLAETAAELSEIGQGLAGRGAAAWELANLLTVATVLTASAYARRETRGCHWRQDWPSRTRPGVDTCWGPSTGRRPDLTWEAA